MKLVLLLHKLNSLWPHKFDSFSLSYQPTISPFLNPLVFLFRRQDNNIPLKSLSVHFQINEQETGFCKIERSSSQKETCVHLFRPVFFFFFFFFYLDEKLSFWSALLCNNQLTKTSANVYASPHFTTGKMAVRLLYI